MEVCLHTLHGPMKDAVFHLPGPGFYVVGRTAEAAVYLAGDTSVSRRHFALELEDGDVLRVKDLESTNGIMVNGIQFGGQNVPGEAAAAPSIRLRDGDQIQVGDTVLRVRIGSPRDDVHTIPARPSSQSRRQQGKAGAVPVPRAASTHRQLPSRQEIHEARTRFIDIPPIPGYDALRFLGAGKRGKIHLAKHQASGEMRAVKMIRIKADASDQAKDKFEREIRTYQALRHPNIVAYYDHGYTDEHIYVVLEYVPGGGLDQLLKLRDGSLPVAEAKPIMLDACAGMAFAHSQGYIHRDLKPSNILLAGEYGDWGAKIADLGLAKSFLGVSAGNISSTGDVGGSYGYMPREQLMDYKNVRPVSDVFSLAATFYVLLTGEFVYDLTGFSSPIEMVVEGKIIRLQDRESAVPVELAEVIDKAIDPDHEKRFQTAGELRAALVSVLGAR